ncbi:MAG: sugar ABC transporter permease, partial [Cephaloticoccus sp.]|nr:sugar ABC transporter permease [Cephaloticoccus sp.]
GTEIALAMVIIPLLTLFVAGFVLGPGLPTAAQAGLPAPNWLGDFYWAKPAIMIMMLWAAIGSNNMILYLAGLSNISPELYEAADMDGASSTQRFWHITWPQLAPVTFFISIMSVIHGLQGGFEMARTMTKGGPAGSTTTLSYYIFVEGFENGRMGYASAVAWTLFILVFTLSIFNFRYGNRHVND